ncbi:MAG TPA: M20/M25/M40 family metallo-hydrolase [Bacteroidales bacterium]|nr:M20/M25/M40 family metallo-hydrolase [Bacteroidales bacterium]HPT20765.1 M20/M25/M40 family metallo-hydrolase [Bacteroidales bacterium]
MKRNLSLIIFFSIITTSLIYGQATSAEKGLDAITSNAIKAQLNFLSSDWTEGRQAGEKGEYISADYIASMLQLYGVKPGGDHLAAKEMTNNFWENERSYFQNFILLKSVTGDQQILKVKTSEGKMVRTINFTYNVDFLTRASSQEMEIDAPVVFAGYGFKSDKFKYNDFNKLDVKGKFILRISDFPEFVKESLSTSELTAAAKEMEAMYRTMGAIGVIDFNPESKTIGKPEEKDFLNMSPSEEVPRPWNPDTRLTIPSKNTPDSFIKISVSVKTANEILKGTGNNIDDYIKKADTNVPYFISPLAGKTVYIKTDVRNTQVAVRNIIGIIEGNNPDQVIVVGAHYDHMGIHNGYIWNGADDNGSGTVGVMTIAKAIMETGKKPDKTIVIALWAAEEPGLLGSRYWIRNPTVPLKSVKLNVNFDMISRYISDLEPNNVSLTYNDSYPMFKEMTLANLNKYGIDLNVDFQPSNDPPGGTDHRAFVEAGIPVMRFKPGHRDEYHTPKDEIGTINWDIMEKIIRISFTNVWELANKEW